MVGEDVVHLSLAGLAPDEQRLTFAGKRLHDDMVLRKRGFQKWDTLDLERQFKRIDITFFDEWEETARTFPYCRFTHVRGTGASVAPLLARSCVLCTCMHASACM